MDVPSMIRFCKRCSEKLDDRDGLYCVICICTLKVSYPCQVCRGNSVYGPIGEKPICCQFHNYKNYPNVISKKCEGIDGKSCMNMASFKLKGEDKLRRCSECIKPEEKYLWEGKIRLCEVCRGTSPGYGYKGKSPTHCVKCKITGMVHLSGKTCEHPNCKNQASFGLIKNRPIYCGNHKGDMEDVKNPKCSYPGCKVSALFGSKNTDKKKFCKSHRPEDYEDFSSNHKCGCGIRANYGYLDCKPVTCGSCKVEGMIRLTIKRCSETDPLLGQCAEKATRGYTIDNIPLKCAKHNDKNMTYVLFKKCKQDNCKQKATHGPLFQNKLHCESHKQNNEYKHNHIICAKCNEPAYYGPVKSLPTHCGNHKDKTHINHVEDVCSLCKGLYTKEPNQIDCYECRMFKNPKVRHQKELEVKAILIKEGIVLEQHDKRIKDGCSKYRPDFLIDCGTFKLIVECDEDQHRNHPKECERARMLQIFQDVGIPVQFIRYNPDSYKNAVGKSVPESNNRVKVLIQQVREVMSWETAPYLVGVIYICYDGFNSGNIINVDLKYEETFAIDRLMIKDDVQEDLKYVINYLINNIEYLNMEESPMPFFNEPDGSGIEGDTLEEL